MQIVSEIASKGYRSVLCSNNQKFKVNLFNFVIKAVCHAYRFNLLPQEAFQIFSANNFRILNYFEHWNG